MLNLKYREIFVSHIWYNGHSRWVVSTRHSVRTHLLKFVHCEPLVRLQARLATGTYYLLAPLAHWIITLPTLYNTDYTPRIIKQKCCSNSLNIKSNPGILPDVFLRPLGALVLQWKCDDCLSSKYKNKNRGTLKTDWLSDSPRWFLDFTTDSECLLSLNSGSILRLDCMTGQSDLQERH